MNLRDLISIIDTGWDAVVRDVVGERVEEYRTAESEAATYKASGYADPIPASVKSWADPKGWTGQQAADDILATAAAWRGASATARTVRLAHKERGRSGEDLNVVLADWLAFVKTIRTSLGV
jgi:hypothetical protein